MNKIKMTIGRNAGNDIVIPETTVSGNHADLVNEGGNWYIIDANSTNGVLVNGTKVSKQRLNNNDLIKLGAATLKIQF
jgi:pSer/pThr/pTyr-binding forkhead associated (FHA) protein